MPSNYLGLHKFIWLLLFLYPVLYNYVGGVGAAQRLMHVFFLIVLISFILFLRPSSSHKRIVLYFFVYTLFVVAYYIFCTLFFTQNHSFSDFADFTRPFVYLMYLSIPLLYPISDDDVIRLFRFILKMLLVSVLFSALVYFPFTYPIVDLYKGRMSDDPVIMHFYRWSGTFGYPSDYSFLISFFIYWQFFRFVYIKNIPKFKFWSLFALLFFALIMTVSRGGIFSAVFMLGLTYLLSSALFKSRVNFVVYPLLLLLFYLFFMVLNSDEAIFFGTDVKYLLGVFDTGSGMDSSSKHRVAEFLIGFEYLQNYFPFGGGANREVLKGIIDPIESFYGYHFLKWGFIGILLQLFAFFVFIMCSTLKSLYQKENEYKAIYAAFATLLLSVPLIIGFSSAMSDRFKTLSVFYLIAGYSVSGLYNKYKKDKGYEFT